MKVITKVNVGTRTLLYGQHATGKTTLAARAPEALFIDMEGSTNKLTGDVHRYDFEGSHVPTGFLQVLDAIKVVGTSEHKYQTLIIDGLERLEGLIWDYVCKRDSTRKTEANPKSKKLISIEDFGFGKGFQVALDEWRLLLRYLERLTQTKGMDIVLIGHSCVRNFANPEGEDYERYQLRLQDSKKCTAAGEVKEWVDDVGFIRFEDKPTYHSDKEERAERPKGYTTGRRLLCFAHSPAYDAKTRSGYADQMLLNDFSWTGRPEKDGE